MTPTFYHVLHVTSLLVLAGYTFFAFGGPAPTTKKKVMMATGIASLLMLVSGVGLMHKLGYEWSGAATKWVYVKLFCWLGLSALAGIAYRRRSAGAALSVVALALGGVAVYMVYYKPF
jgi:uncharacterized membrane protein SirB2